MLNPQAPLLQLASHTFQNQVDKNTWQCATFTCDSEYVAAASASKDTHQIHIWTRWGRLERILEGTSQKPSAPRTEHDEHRVSTSTLVATVGRKS